MKMKRLILAVFIILVIAIPASASMSKLYVGDENGQAIFGIETTVANNDGALGGEIRTYLSKKGMVINGVEYGSLPGRTMYNFHVAGKSESAMIRYDHNTFVNHFIENGAAPVYNNNSISLRGGNSLYLFYE